MSNAEYAVSVLKKYPAIKSADGITVDFLGMKPNRFCVRSEPTDQIVKRYLNGDTIRRFSFALEGVADTISDKDRTNNNELFEGLALWLETKSRLRRLPQMGAGAKAMKMVAAGGAYLATSAEDGDTAVYQMQIVLEYYQKM